MSFTKSIGREAAAGRSLVKGLETAGSALASPANTKTSRRILRLGTLAMKRREVIIKRFLARSTRLGLTKARTVVLFNETRRNKKARTIDLAVSAGGPERG